MTHHSPQQAPGPQLPTSTAVLIPGLPDHISIICLSHVPPSLLSAVCRRWRRLIYSPPFPPFLSLYTLLLPSDHHSHSSNTFQFSSFDPISRLWTSLPPPPANQFLLRHPSFISRNLPIQSVSVAGKLIVVAATDDRFSPALPKPLIFNPTVNSWSYVPELIHPRRWCAIGSAGTLIYAVSGIGAQYSTEIATSVEKLDVRDDPCNRRWKKAAALKDGRFSREPIGAVGWRGKLCVVNVVAKEGMMYDVAADEWTEMPPGMVEGWRGPAAAMEEETIYGVEEMKGLLKKYDHVHDTWVEVMESEVLKGVVDVAAARGKVCVVCGGGLRIVVVDTVVAGVWVVEVPEGFRVAAIHILPRMNRVN